MEAFAVPFLLFVGALLALQAAANVQLSTATGSPFGASTLQLGIGAALLLAATAVVGSLDAFGLLAEAEPWHLIGGLGSAIYIISGIVLFPRWERWSRSGSGSPARCSPRWRSTASAGSAWKQSLPARRRRWGARPCCSALGVAGEGGRRALPAHSAGAGPGWSADRRCRSGLRDIHV
jgi:hypothetical protein